MVEMHFCSCTGSVTGFSCSSSLKYSRTVRFTCAASGSCSRAMRLLLLALASMKLPSTERRSKNGPKQAAERSAAAD